MNQLNRKTSVIIPVFNGEKYLAEAINSVLNQTRPADEILVIDDGSTDRSGEIAGRFQPGISRVRQENQGPAAARNKGVELASGDVLAFLDADDIWHAEKLARQLDLLADLAEAVVLCHFAPLLAPGTDWPPAFKREYYQANPVCVLPSGLLLTRRAWLSIGPFNPIFRTGEDAEWFFRARARGTTELVAPQVLVQKRFHDANLGRQGSPRDLLRGLRGVLKRPEK